MYWMVKIWNLFFLLAKQDIDGDAIYTCLKKRFQIVVALGKLSDYKAKMCETQLHPDNY